MSQHVRRMSIACILLGIISPIVWAETLILDRFPGYAQDSNWQYDWIRGVGSVTFNAGDPGFAHLLLDGPGISGTYHNAEIYQVEVLNRTPPYCDFEVRLRNSNNNGFDTAGNPIEPLDPLNGIGSRGWGLWNRITSPTQGSMNQIWFMSVSPQSEDEFQGTRIWIIRNNVPVVAQILAIDLTQWHTYRVQWRSDYIGVFIDDMAEPVAEVTDSAMIPAVPMSYTMWTDNYVFTGTYANPSIGYLAVPDFEQYIDVDYVWVYTGGDPGDLDSDGDVDGFDFLTFSNCYNGSNRPLLPACENPLADLDTDEDVDGFDFLSFSNCYNGSNNPGRCQ